MDRPRPWFRYVEASDLGDTDVDFDALDVKSPAGEKLGEVEGFIIDADNARPYYVVVDGGGWFKSKHYLLPIGHTRFDSARQIFIVDLDRDRIDRYPGFDLDEFEQLSDADFEHLEMNIASACCPNDIAASGSKAWGDGVSHHEQPDWWQSNYYRPDRAGSKGVTAGAEWSAGGEKTRPDRPATAHDRSRR